MYIYIWQVAYLQAQLVQVKGQLLAQGMVNVNSRNGENDWASGTVGGTGTGTGYGKHAYNTEGDGFQQEMQDSSWKKRAPQIDLGELQALASRMMKNWYIKISIQLISSSSSLFYNHACVYIQTIYLQIMIELASLILLVNFIIVVLKFINFEDNY